MISRLVRFLILGTFNSILGIVVFFFGFSLLDFPLLVANAASFAVPFFIAFLVGPNFVFSQRFLTMKISGVMTHFSTFLLSYLANLALIISSSLFFGLSALVLQILGMLAYSTAFFSLNHYWVFRSAGKTPPPQPLQSR